MTRYRKKPVEVEAWQVGSDEPMPEWVREHLAIYPHILEKYAKVGLWLVKDSTGYVSYCTRYQFYQTYEVIE